MYLRANSIPPPDPAITKLEDDLVKGQAAVTSSTKDVWFPRRPGFGTQGSKVILWANYFKLNASADIALLKYSLKVQMKDKAKSDEKDGRKSDRKVGEPKGGKLHAIIKAALDQIAGSVPFATEYKDQVITLEPFSLPEGSIVVVPYKNEGKDDVYEVKFHGPVTIDLPGLRSYLETMRHPSDVSMPKIEDAIDALSIITGHSARSNADVSTLGRSRYFPLTIQGEQYNLGWPDFNRIIRGYFQSARPATGRLILNVNVTHGLFRPKGFVSDIVEMFLSGKEPRSAFQDLHKSLSKLKAQCRILSPDDPKKDRLIQKVICGLADPSDGTGSGGMVANRPKVRVLGATAIDVQFYLRAPAPPGLRGDAYCSVADYYKKRYKYTVDARNPVVNVGTKAKPVYMPAELVRVLDGQALKRMAQGEETRDMVNFAARSPFANATSISTHGRRVLGLDSSASDTLGRFGLQVDKGLLTVQGRELVPPAIVYKDERPPNDYKVISANDGDWNMDRLRVVKPGKRIDRWFWISVDFGPEKKAHQKHTEIADGIRFFIELIRRQGIAIADTSLSNRDSRVTVPWMGDPRQISEIIKPVFERMKFEDPQFVFVVLAGKKNDALIYNEVKKLGDIQYGYLSQVILQTNLLKRSSQLCANLGLKVNLKMGGVNHKLRDDIAIIRQQPTMVVGYDVTHPTNLAGNTSGLPSLVGMVASIDSDLGQWPGTIWAQGGLVEMLDETLEKRFAERLQLYRQHNRQLPANIIIFRDGVSEGQFAQVLDKELPHIRNACKAVYPAKEQPKIALIVSVKRHQTRFFPTDPRHTVKSRNIKNGTVVDRGVTQATRWDFFLTAHKGLQGTSRPAHYTVLLDEVFRALSRENAADQLEKLTFDMSHLFGRATKAVSLCPPAYYADILCTRARVYLSELFGDSDTHSTMSGAAATAQDVISIDVHKNLRNSMFYI
ncbi:Piwi-domain-containing protein [Xylaria intraflava]|nr:Piwi-domain-containing protein [Xylaria intraflava]